MSDLYFYVIKIKDPSKETLNNKSFKKDSCGSKLEKKTFFFKDSDFDFWIFTYTNVPSGANDVISGKDRIVKTIGSIKAILESVCKNRKFDKMLFGIHGSDWGIEGDDYDKGDIFFPQSIDRDKYQKHIELSNTFFDELKKDYKAEECKVKLLSHAKGDANTIYTLFTDKTDTFLTKLKQYKIFSISPDASSDKKDVKNVSNEPNFITDLDSDIEQLNRLETLFFEFRLCLATLNALNDNENHDLLKETVERMIVLLKGGTLKRAWTENIIVETEPAEKGYTSLKNNHYTEELKIPGIGHYVQLYGGGTSQIQKCIKLLWNKESSKDELIKNLKEVEPVIKDILEAEQKKSEKSK